MPGRADDQLGPFLERVVLPSGWHVLHEPSVESTMDLAREAARGGWPDRTLFVTDYQSQGRGRQGRVWVCPPYAGLLTTVLLRRPAAPPHTYTVLVAVSVCEAIERLLALEPAIKWPNDVMLDGQKTMGVLAEASSDGREQTVIVGFGINVNLDSEELAELPNATSLSIQAGRQVHRGELLALIVERLDSWLRDDRHLKTDALWQAWNGRLWGRDQRVRVREGEQELTGTVLGGERDGTLLLRLTDGGIRRVVAGEVLL
ncbi:MAG: biotin--[acetyl-CoA-carboxylase] ligase [Chloroflexi bacterium]|nr:biotin--[acetyl-CoA-carboxylase] ligase [Chloroflexota bacterium]